MSTETTVGIREFGSSEDGEDEKAEREMGLCFWGSGKKMRLSIGIAIEEHRDGRSRAAFGPTSSPFQLKGSGLGLPVTVLHAGAN